MLVQLVRTPACHVGGHQFESDTFRRIIWDISINGSMTDLHSVGEGSNPPCSTETVNYKYIVI